MTSLKVWTRTLRLWGRRQGRHLLYKRWVRQVLYFLQNFSLPGGRGVPLYDILGYFIAGSFGSSIAQRAKGLAFSFLSALPPLMIFIFSLIAYLPFDGLQDEFMTELSEIVPGKIMTPLSDTVNDVMGHKHTTLLSIGFITSIILAANGMNGFILSLNFANQTVEKRPFFQRFLLCIMMVFVLYIIIVLVLGLLIGHKYLLQLIFSQGWLTDTKANTLMFNIGRWVLLSIAMLMALAIIYYFAPASRMFFILSWGFGIYINNFSRYNLLYGSIGTLLLLMLWIYFSCIVILVGYELNTSIYNGTLRQKNRSARRELRQKIQIFNNDNTEE